MRRTDEKKKRKGSKSKGKMDLMEKGEKKMGRDERGRQRGGDSVGEGERREMLGRKRYRR